MILVIDNYDSFVHNLARYVRLLGFETLVVRNDKIQVADVERLHPAAVVLSPGPKGPREAGICLQLVRELNPETPLLGICLGHQVLVEALGGEISINETPTHGRSSRLHHDGRYLFRDLPSPVDVGRYHSLHAIRDTLPKCLDVFGELADGTVMAVAHRAAPWFGLQFHPESILTEHGGEMLSRFFELGHVVPFRQGQSISLFTTSGKS